MNYYKRPDVRQAILNFAKAGMGHALRECAFYNDLARTMQRYFNEGTEKQIVIFDSERSLDKALAGGASAFYCSYWRYVEPRALQYPIGHDLVWTVRATSGGVKFAKAVTASVVDALSDWVETPWIKYSGELGFDLILPLEAVPSEAWMGNIEALGDIQRGLTSYVMSYLAEKFSSFSIHGTTPPFRVQQGSNTCLLSELRVRRGLLLAPMSLNPRSGLVSLPIMPNKLEKFSALDSSPADAKAYFWEPPKVSSISLKLAQKQLMARV